MQHGSELNKIWSNLEVDFDDLFFLIGELQDALDLRRVPRSDRVEAAFAAFKEFMNAGFTARDKTRAAIDEVENTLRAMNDN
ncbi:hypothetical protein [Reyranella soli]|uniref:Uncharacterized protein n=1 Tax=Reyranella soli TaxID=1230389 RepID=A0A512NNP6_9HYPH|nr:hypothetical protein [Reyranella soli]GEP60552.1 hypothetical protein RSO01_77180 [Reyranella soli]